MSVYESDPAVSVVTFISCSMGLSDQRNHQT